MALSPHNKCNLFIQDNLPISPLHPTHTGIFNFTCQNEACGETIKGTGEGFFNKKFPTLDVTFLAAKHSGARPICKSSANRLGSGKLYPFTAKVPNSPLFKGYGSIQCKVCGVVNQCQLSDWINKTRDGKEREYHSIKLQGESDYMPPWRIAERQAMAQFERGSATGSEDREEAESTAYQRNKKRVLESDSESGSDSPSGPSCPVCFEEYTASTEADKPDHTPFLLHPCGHALCKSCVTTCISGQRSECVTCRTAMTSPPTKNFSLLEVLESYTHMVSPKSSSRKKIRLKPEVTQSP
eukprot:GHVN01017477.1.p1 GENE.GHVN01017477.1~~GHVN01017477.1.p1  ORF type:complete len:297 (-),score=46.71 GHVN01017477.1:318-1208(-)